MSKSRRYEPIQLNIKPSWKIGKGHNPHRSGSGVHNNLPKRQRTRGDANRKAINEH